MIDAIENESVPADADEERFSIVVLPEGDDTEAQGAAKRQAPMLFATFNVAMCVSADVEPESLTYDGNDARALQEIAAFSYVSAKESGYIRGMRVVHRLVVALIAAVAVTGLIGAGVQPGPLLSSVLLVAAFGVSGWLVLVHPVLAEARAVADRIAVCDDGSLPSGAEVLSTMSVSDAGTHDGTKHIRGTIDCLPGRVIRFSTDVREAS